MKLTVHDRGSFKHVFADNHHVGNLVRFSSTNWLFVCHRKDSHWVLSPLQLEKAVKYGDDQAALLNITQRLKG